MTSIHDAFAKLKVKKEDIKETIKIETGFTNDIYFVALLDGKKFKVRKASENKYINRNLEKYIEENLNKKEIYFYDKDGSYIRKWIEGHTLTIKDLNADVWNNIISKIKDIQNLKIPKTMNITTPIYILNNVSLNEELLEPLKLYKSIIKKISEKDLVLSHNDISTNNIICKGKDISIIDYEWSSLNHKLWDISNLIKDLELNYEDLIANDIIINNYDIKELIEFIFATHFFTIFWTYKVPETKKIVDYRNEVINRTKYWFKIINKS